MNIAVLGAANSWYLRDLERAADGRHVVVPASFSELAVSLNPETGSTDVYSAGQRLNDFDAVLVRAMPPGTLEQVVFRMNGLARLQHAGTLVLNPPRTLEIAIDKFLTTAQLVSATVPTVVTLACQTAEAALEAFERLGGDVVVKPLFGGEGRGILRVSDPDLAYRTFRTLEQLRAVIYIQRFVEHFGYDIRVLFLGAHEHYAIKRSHPDDWRTNLGRGGLAEPFALGDEMLALAARAAEVVGAPLAGIDLLPARDGKIYVLEVNAVPGWKGLAKTLDVDIAARILRYLDGKQHEFQQATGS